ncbi:MAG: (d)CMP kinase, partial [Oscillospiraceae bacterium]
MFNVAIDGPSGAGKSTVAKSIAKQLGYIYVDTGALYRAIGLYCSQKGADTTVSKEVEPLLNDINLELRFVDDAQRVFLNGNDVSQDIRLPQMSMHASNVSAHKCVREFLFDLQRDMAKKNNVIMDGRDIGTVV